MDITKDMTFGELLAYDMELGNVLQSVGMHCAFCPAHSFETLEQGCMVHGLDVDDVIAALDDYLAQKA